MGKVEDIPGETLAKKKMAMGILHPISRRVVVSDEARDRRRRPGCRTGAVRAYVMGERGAHNEPATEEDIAPMAALVRDALRAGALRGSTSRTMGARKEHGELVPGTYAAEDELLGLLGQVGHGVFEMATDMTGPTPAWNGWSSCSKETGRPVSFIPVHLTSGPMLDGRELLERIGRFNQDGARLGPAGGGCGQPHC